MEYFNKIGWTNFFNKPVFEKIDLLLNNNVFFVSEKDWDDYISYLKSHIKELDSINYSECDIYISKTPYLQVNRSVISEISDKIRYSFKNNPEYHSIIEIELKEDYSCDLLGVINRETRESVICKYIEKTVKEIKSCCDYDLNGYFKATEYLNEIDLGECVEEYLDYIVFENRESGLFEEEKQKLFRDIIAHVTPLSDLDHPLAYHIASSFQTLKSLLRTLDYFKNELKRNKHEEIVQKGANGSNYSIKNIHDEKNRFPKVFVDAYACELFLYIKSFSSVIKPITFSYYYSIFKNNKYLSRKVKPSYYLEFINSVYGLKEVRLRTDLSLKKENNHINDLIKLKKDFDALMSSIA